MVFDHFLPQGRVPSGGRRLGRVLLADHLDAVAEDGDLEQPHEAGQQHEGRRADVEPGEGVHLEVGGLELHAEDHPEQQGREDDHPDVGHLLLRRHAVIHGE